MAHQGKRIACALAMAATATTSMATLATASPAPQDNRESATAYADVDGDGAPNAVTVREVADDVQTLTFAFAGGQIDTTFPADARPPLQQPRPVDIDGDGLDEVIVAHSVGANTLTFNIWKFEPGEGIVRLRTSAGAPFEVYEGGGVSATSGYGCTPTPDGREFVTVQAAQAGDPAEQRFDGDRTSYRVHGDAVSVESRTPIEQAPADHPLLDIDPATCAPLS